MLRYHIDINLCVVLNMSQNDVALLFKALGDSNRLEIVKLLSEGEKCGCKLLEALDITQPTLSHHMRILCQCGLVQSRRVGKWSHYSLNCATLAALKAAIGGLSRPKEEGDLHGL